MTNRSEFERQLENIVYSGFPDDIRARATIVVALRELVEKSVPRACQSTNHSPLDCRYDPVDEPIMQCSECSSWFCWLEFITNDDRCNDCRPPDLDALSIP